MSKRRSSLFVLLAVLLGLLGPASVAVALDNSTVDNLTHFTQCAQWMLTDPDKHAKYCSPGHDVFVSGSTGFATAPRTSSGG
jgi:hypothetical protein